MREYLEEHYKDETIADEAAVLKLVVKALSQVVQSGAQNIEIAVLKPIPGRVSNFFVVFCYNSHCSQESVNREFCRSVRWKSSSNRLKQRVPKLRLRARRKSDFFLCALRCRSTFLLSIIHVLCLFLCYFLSSVMLGVRAAINKFTTVTV